MTIIEKIMGHLARYRNAKADISNFLTEKAGVDTPDGALIDELAAMLSDVPAGGKEDFEITDAQYLFFENARMDAMDVLIAHLTRPTNIHYMFRKSSVKAVDLSACDFTGIDTSVTNHAGYVFAWAPIEDLRNIIFPASGLAEGINAANWFYQCTELKHAIFNDLKFNGIGTMNGWFGYCTALIDADLSGIRSDGHVVGPGSLEFIGCTSLQSVTFGRTTKFVPTNMQQTFNDCPALRSVDITMVEPVSTRLNVTYLFETSTALEEIIGYGLWVWPRATAIGSTALKRLTFAPRDNAIGASVSIANKAFEVSGFREMVESLPVKSGLTLTITGNPCITGTRKDGTACETINDEDRAAVTAKGWTLVE